jgi:hypothetical protein
MVTDDIQLSFKSCYVSFNVIMCFDLAAVELKSNFWTLDFVRKNQPGFCK